MNRFAQHLWHALAGVLLPGLIVGSQNLSLARAETFFPAQDITISGRMTPPSCTARLEESHLNFEQEKNQGTNGVQSQTLKLNVSQCEIDEIGVLFKADYWPYHPARGQLRGKASQKLARYWYYMLAPENENSAAWPLILASDSPELEIDVQNTTESNSKEKRYFSLKGVNYWYELKDSLRAGDALIIPFSVTVRHINTGGGRTDDEEMDGTFTLQLTYR